MGVEGNAVVVQSGMEKLKLGLGKYTRGVGRLVNWGIGNRAV